MADTYTNPLQTTFPTKQTIAVYENLLSGYRNLQTNDFAIKIEDPADGSLNNITTLNRLPIHFSDDYRVFSDTTREILVQLKIMNKHLELLSEVSFDETNIEE